MNVMEMQKITRMPKESARDYALRFLRHNIINFHIPPGTMVSAADLAEITGISRTPIREAMQELEKTGIVEIFPQAGSRISHIDYSKIHESCFIRITLEKEVVGVACDYIGPRDESAFEEILKEQQRCAKNGDNDNFLELDHRFHRQLYVLTDKLMTYQTVENCLWHFNRLRRLSFNAISLPQLIEDHRGVFEAVKARDKRLAKKLVHTHLTRYLDDEKIIREKYPEYFAD